MQWGSWSFNPKTLTLDHEIGYEIDLEEIDSSASILDWIFQVRGKNWADAQTVYDLLNAFREILHPQANYCSYEEDKRADGGELARAYAQRIRSLHVLSRRYMETYTLKHYTNPISRHQRFTESREIAR